MVAEIEKTKKNPESNVETQNEQAKERADLSLELKEKAKKKSIKEQIDEIESKESITDQKEGISTLNIVLNNLILKALGKEGKIDDIKRNPVVELEKITEKEEEKSAISKLSELIKNNPEYVSGWVGICKKAEKEYKKADSAKKSIEKGKTPEGHEWMPTAVRAGLVIGGAIGAYNLWQWFKKEDTKEDPKKMPYISAAITTLGVGALIGPDRLASWSAKYMGLSFGTETLGKFWDNLKKFKFKEAFGSFLFSDANPGIEKTAEKLDIDKSLLIDLKDVTYEKFHDFKSDAGRKTKSYISEALGFMGFDNSSNTIGTDVDDQLRNAGDEQKLLEFIEANKQLIKGKNIEKMTITEILNELDKAGALDKVQTSGKESVDEDKDKATVGDLETMGDKFPKAKEAYEAYKNGDIGLSEAAALVVKGTVDDGSALVVKDGSLFLVKYGMVAFISSAEIWLDTVKDIYGIMKGEKGVSDLVTDIYDDGGGWWIGAGAVIGALRSDNPIRGAIKGGFSGIKMAYNLVPWSIKTGYKGIKTVGDLSKRSSYGTRELLNISVRDSLPFLAKASETEKAAFYQERALYHAEEFKKFQLKNDSSTSAGVKGTTDRILEKIFPNWAKEEMILNGKFFVEYRMKYLEAMEKIHLATNDEAKLKSIREEMKTLKMTNTEITEGIKKGNGVETKLKDATEEFITKEKVSADIAPVKVNQHPIEGLPESENKTKFERIKKTHSITEEYFKDRCEERRLLEAGGSTKEELTAYDDITKNHLTKGRDTLIEAINDVDQSKLSNEEALAFESLIKKELSQGIGIRGIFTKEYGKSILKSRGKFAVVFGIANVVIESYQLTQENKEAIVKKELMEMVKEVGLDTVQIILDILCPFGLSDWYTVVTGEEVLTGKEVSGWSRAGRAVFGTYNVATDLIAVAGGVVTAPAGAEGAIAVATVADAAEGAARLALKGAGKAPDIIKRIPEIIRSLTMMAHSVGGFKGLLPIVQKWSGNTMKGILVADVGMLAGTVAMAGYDIMFDTEGQEEIVIDSIGEEETTI